MLKVTWKYSTEQISAFSFEAPSESALPLNSTDTNLFADISLLSEPEPVFTDHPLDLKTSVNALPSLPDTDESLDLDAYYHVFVSSMSEAEALKERLEFEANIDSIQIQERPQAPYYHDTERDLALDQITSARMMVPSTTNNFESYQGYLDAAPAGINARYAWSVLGGKGKGITIIDIESGWDFQHEDLSNNLIGLLGGINSASHRDHGTAVLGVFSGDMNGFGVTGIVPEARAGAVSATYDWNLGKWNAANAIYQAVKHLGPGDIILLEMHAPGPNATGSGQQGFIPIEYWDAEFDAIKYAASKGIYVIECAGNGGENLDDVVYQNKFDPQFRDSMAIMVGAGASGYQADARSRLGFSNYGKRLDVQGWGENIVTCGGRDRANYHDLHDHPNPSRCYTQSFGGTSGAGPIVSGAAASITSSMVANSLSALNPVDMRDLLKNTGSPQTDGKYALASAEPIGPLPDIKNALASLDIE